MSSLRSLEMCPIDSYQGCVLSVQTGVYFCIIGDMKIYQCYIIIR